MSALVGLLKNILELISVLFKFIFTKIEDGIGILLIGKVENRKLNRELGGWRENINFPKKKKDLVYSGSTREDEEKEARIKQLMKVQATKTEFDTGLEDEYLYTAGSRWAIVEDYEEPIGI